MTQGQNNQPIRISGEHFPGNCRLNGCEKCREASDTDHLYSDIGSEDSMFGVVMLAKRRAEKIIGGCRTMRERELVETRATIEAAFAIDGHCEVIELVREAVDYVVTLPEGEISSLTAKNVIRSLGMLSMRAKWLRD